MFARKRLIVPKSCLSSHFCEGEIRGVMWRNRWHIFWQAFLFTCAASYANELVFQWFYACSAEINSLSFAIAAGTQRSDLHVSHIHCLVKSQCWNVLCLGLLGTIARSITLWVKFKQRFMLTQETSFIQKYFYYICQSVHTLFFFVCCDSYACIWPSICYPFSYAFAFA